MAVDLLGRPTSSFRRRAGLSLAIFLAGCFLVFGASACQPSLASREKAQITGRNQTPSLALTTDQIAFLEYNVPKALAWRRYWTEPDANTDPFYSAKAGKKLLARYVSLECAVIVWFNEREDESVLYVKMPNGRLDYPGFLGWTMGKEDLDGLMTGAQNSSNWPLFLFYLDYPSEGGPKLAPELKEKYRQQFKSKSSYQMIEGEITPPPLGLPSYEPDSATKGLLLDRIISATRKEANKSFENGEMATITVPNFNVGDPGIWVLIENTRGPGMVIGFQLCTNPNEEPVIFGGVVNWDITVDRYSVKDDTVEKIRSQPVKVLKYRVEVSPS